MATSIQNIALLHLFSFSLYLNLLSLISFNIVKWGMSICFLFLWAILLCLRNWLTLTITFKVKHQSRGNQHNAVLSLFFFLHKQNLLSSNSVNKSLSYHVSPLLVSLSHFLVIIFEDFSVSRGCTRWQLSISTPAGTSQTKKGEKRESKQETKKEGEGNEGWIPPTFTEQMGSELHNHKVYMWDLNFLRIENSVF